MGGLGSVANFSYDSTRQIARTVQEWQRYPKERDIDQRPYNPAPLPPMVATAEEDIEHNTLGTVNLTHGGDFTATLTEDTTIQYEVYNPGLKVWDGARLLIQHCRLPRSTKMEWNIIHAWSATRIRCTAPVGGITAGSSGTCTSVTALNGHFSPTSATVYSWTTNVDVGGSEKLLAELVWTGTVSRWEIYSADCT